MLSPVRIRTVIGIISTQLLIKTRNIAKFAGYFSILWLKIVDKPQKTYKFLEKFAYN